MDKRTFLKSTALLGLTGIVNKFTAFGGDAQMIGNTTFFEETSPFQLPKLPYSFDALEPNIDKMTMEIHHGKHHKGYVDKLNAAIKGTALEKMSLEEILKEVGKHPDAVRNNAGGHYNHSLFWTILTPKGGQPGAGISAAINKKFGSFDKFKTEFSKAGATRFGSGWAWLIVDPQGELKITSTPNQDNTLMDISEDKGTPILGVDVWEHAYYLKYQNKRADYIEAFFKIINWNEVGKRYAAAIK